ncbi:hypothetical protein D3C76_1090210 [compost metagenome]
MAIGRIGLCGGRGGGVDFLGRGLEEGGGQRLPGSRINAVQQRRSGAAAATRDEIVSGQFGHDSLLNPDWKPGDTVLTRTDSFPMAFSD